MGVYCKNSRFWSKPPDFWSPGCRCGYIKWHMTWMNKLMNANAAGWAVTQFPGIIIRDFPCLLCSRNANNIIGWVAGNLLTGGDESRKLNRCSDWQLNHFKFAMNSPSAPVINCCFDPPTEYTFLGSNYLRFVQPIPLPANASCLQKFRLYHRFQTHRHLFNISIVDVARARAPQWSSMFEEFSF